MKQCLQNLFVRLLRNSDLLWVVALLAGCGWLIRSQGVSADSASVATLVGALVGGAAVLLGNWINRYDERRRAAIDADHRRAKIKALIAAELVDVAAGLLGAKRLLDAALTSLQAGGPVADQLDMTSVTPRGMPFAESLGMDLFNLEQPAIDALVTLRSNLSITRMNMAAVTEGRDRFGLLSITALSEGIRQDMGVLAKAFECIAPGRKLEIDDKPPELASVIMTRMALPPTPPQKAQ